MSAFTVASEMLDWSFGEMETEVSGVGSDYHALPPPPPPPPPPTVIKKKRKFSSYKGAAKAACNYPIAGHSNEIAPKDQLDKPEAGGAFEYLHIDLE